MQGFSAKTAHICAQQCQRRGIDPLTFGQHSKLRQAFIAKVALGQIQRITQS
jgi:hypothetical protein